MKKKRPKAITKMTKAELRNVIRKLRAQIRESEAEVDYYPCPDGDR